MVIVLYKGSPSKTNKARMGKIEVLDLRRGWLMSLAYWKPVNSDL